MSFALRIALVLFLIILIEFYFYKKLTASVNTAFPKLDILKFKKRAVFIFILLNIYPLTLLGAWIYSALTHGGRPQMPDSNLFNYFILYPFWFSALIILQSVIYLLIIDLLRLLTLPVYMRYKDKIKPVLSKIILVVIGFFLFYVPARIIYDYKSVSVRIVEYTKKDLPDELNNFRLTFISDVQADKFTDGQRLDNFISKVNSTNPDLVLMAGDVITSTPDYINVAAEYLGKIRSKYGVFTCVGDHDNWAYRPDSKRSIREITEALQKKGIEMVNNDRRVLKIKDAEIGVTFVTNTYVESANVQTLDILTNGKLNNFDLKIFLTHQPGFHLVENAVKNDYDLFLAGHTHGGQVTFLFPFITLSPTLFETPFVRGNFEIENMLMIVTRGLGMSIIPLRYNSTPEVTLIILKNS